MKKTTKHLTCHILLATTVLVTPVWTSSAMAASIASRAELQGLLIGPGTLEDFEAAAIPADGGSGVFCSTGSTLDSTSVCTSNYGNLGPGLVNADLSIVKTSGDFQWHGSGFFLAPSRELLVVSGEMIVDFANPVGAFGLDLRGLGSPFTGPAEVIVRGVDDTTILGALPVSIGDAVPVFAGWFDPNGIGSIKLTLIGGNGFTPTIDNLVFGAVVPAPAPLALLVSGLAGLVALRRRSVRGGGSSA